MTCKGQRVMHAYVFLSSQVTYRHFPGSESFVLSRTLTMAWGKPRSGKGKGGPGKKGAKRQQQEEPEECPEYLKAVDPRWSLNKSALRAYASASGSPFYAAQSQSDTDYLSLTNLLAKMEPYTSEVTNRLGIALSEAGGTVTMGAELLQKYAAEPAQTGEKLGVQGVAALFATDAGKAFVAAAATFNKHKQESPKDKASLGTAAQKWVEFLGEDPEGKAKALQRMVKSSAKTYLLGMEMLQWLAAAKNPAGWAGKLKPRKGLQPEQVQKWLRQPSEKSRLVAALVGAYEAQIEVQAKKTGQTLSESEASSASAKSVGGGGGNGSSNGSGTDPESSSGSGKKSKKKKAAKGGKKAKKDKKNKKEANQKKDKAKKKKTSSSKSSQSNGSSSVSPSTLRKRKGTDLKKKDKKKKEKRSNVKVYRVTGATADGKIQVKESDLHDDVGITDDSVTVADVQLQLLATLGLQEDAANWSCKQLVNGKILPVSPEFPAVELGGDLVMVSKGG